MYSDEQYKEIQTFWEESAEHAEDQDGLKPTARDPFLQEVVEGVMERWLQPDMHLLDIGCGDGASTLRFARSVAQVVGIDYIERYVEIARDQSARVKNVSFEKGNVLDLSSQRGQHGMFDVVSTIRCLINLPNWAMQRDALEEIAESVKPGGLYLSSEGWQDGFDGLNAQRKLAGLPPMKLAKYNKLLEREEFEKHVGEYFSMEAYVNLGFYLFMSRVWQPVWVAPEPPKHEHPINKIAATLVNDRVGADAFCDCDYAGVYVLRRKR